MKLTVFFACMLLKYTTSKGARVVNGSRGDIRNFPYLIALERDNWNFCCGVVYSKSIIITAAHCVDVNKNKIRVRAGSSYRLKGGTLRNVLAVAVHENYKKTSTPNDIAILKLSRPLKFSSKIKALKLATKTPAHGATAIICGFGFNNQNGVLRNQLQHAKIKILGRKECSGRPYNKHVNDGTICGYGGKVDTCSGDSGGPLVVNGALAGITSYGPTDCGSINKPAIYTDVAFFKEWIKKKAKHLNNSVPMENVKSN